MLTLERLLDFMAERGARLTVERADGRLYLRLSVKVTGGRVDGQRVVSQFDREHANVHLLSVRTEQLVYEAQAAISLQRKVDHAEDREAGGETNSTPNQRAIFGGKIVKPDFELG